MSSLDGAAHQTQGETNDFFSPVTFQHLVHKSNTVFLLGAINLF